jgi:tetratricopeptide (TPR) repeat protein
MAVANVAWILAANGYRVLAADWDLESPGLHRFLHPFLGRAERGAPGVIELIRAYQRLAAASDTETRLNVHIPESARVEKYAFTLKWTFPSGGSLDFLPAGQQNVEYVATLGAMDWDNFYDSLNGGEFLDALRANMKDKYDYALIDSRTGLTDVADICTVHLPDALVDCFTLSTQGIEGAERTARHIQERYPENHIRVLPVPMRVDRAEKERVEAGRAFAIRLFAGFPEGMDDSQRREYWGAVEVPYQPFYAFEEMLAVFGDTSGQPGSLLASFERITAHITEGAVTSLPVMDEDLRNRVRLQFMRKPTKEGNALTVEFLPEDQMWGEWLSGVMSNGGFVVRQRSLAEPLLDPAPDESPQDDDERSGGMTVTVVSAPYLARRGEQPASRSGHAVYVTVTQPIPEFASGNSAFLAGVGEDEAIERLHTMLGITVAARAPVGSYPGDQPRISRVNARNVRFTGREHDLSDLRTALRTGGEAVVVTPVALHGLGGVGKTQMALEYVHRFMSDYDLVWWIECGQPQFIDVGLADLAERVQAEYEVTVPPGATADMKARFVIDLLSAGRVVPRWLLIYDNAEDIDAVAKYIPSGGGHVLLTSRNGDWTARTSPIEIEVFQREESVAHLMRIVPDISREEADDVAAALGDLPLAVETAAVWLKDTNYSVQEFLGRLKADTARTLSSALPENAPSSVLKAWDPSLDLLSDRSKSGARLLELCSVMAPGIARDLVYSSPMAEVLEPFDASLSEPVVMGRVVHEASKLALVKVDANLRQIQIHRLVQAVIRSRMSEESAGSARRDVHHVLVGCRPEQDVDDPAGWARFRMIWPHLTPSDALSSTEEQVRQLYIDRVRYLWVLGDLERARSLAEEVVARWEKALDSDMPEPAKERLRRQLLQLQFNQANALRSMTRLADARTLDEKVLAEQTALLGADHAHTLITAGSLAADLRAVGRYREALAMDTNTYDAWTGLYGEDDRRSLTAANNLAVSMRLTGDVSAALRLDSDTFERRRQTLGATHPLTLSSARSLGRDLLEVGDYSEALNRANEAYRLCMDAIGADSPEALDARVLLGIALRTAGRPNEAEDHFTGAFGGLTRRFGDQSSQVLGCRLSHSTNLLAMDKADAAEAEIREVLAEYGRRLGNRHPNTLVCGVNLATALRMRKEYQPALDQMRETAVLMEEGLGPNHPYTLAASMVLGSLYADAGDLDEAEDIEEKTTTIMDRALGKEHPDTLRCRANMLLTRLQQGDPAAESERDRVVDRLAKVLGTDHHSVATLRGGRRLMRALDPQPF